MARHHRKMKLSGSETKHPVFTTYTPVYLAETIGYVAIHKPSSKANLPTQATQEDDKFCHITWRRTHLILVCDSSTSGKDASCTDTTNYVAEARIRHSASRLVLVPFCAKLFGRKAPF